MTTVLQLAVNLLEPMGHGVGTLQAAAASLLELLRDAFLTPLGVAAAGHTGLILAAYTPLALGLGRCSGFLLAPWRWPPLGVLLRGSLPLLLMPALGEELLFRVALLPHPSGAPDPWPFLLQCALLGLACVLAYASTGSLWPPVLIHWLAVAAWLGPLEGHRCLADSDPSDAPTS